MLDRFEGNTHSLLSWKKTYSGCHITHQITYIPVLIIDHHTIKYPKLIPAVPKTTLHKNLHIKWLHLWFLHITHKIDQMPKPCIVKKHMCQTYDRKCLSVTVMTSTLMTLFIVVTVKKYMGQIFDRECPSVTVITIN